MSIENGYTRIANDILDALWNIRIPGEARRLFDYIIRMTWGYNRKGHIITNRQFSEALNIKQPNIVRALKKLEKMNLIWTSVIQTDKDFLVTYGIQKDFTKWKPLSKQITVIQTDKKPLSKRIKPLIQKDITSKDNIKDNIKDKVYSPFLKIFDHWNSKNIVIHKKDSKQFTKAYKYFKARFKEYTLDEIMQAIDNYDKVLKLKGFFKYKWTLPEFLQRENADKFYDVNFQLDNFMDSGTVHQSDTLDDRLKKLGEKIEREERNKNGLCTIHSISRNY